MKKKKVWTKPLVYVWLDLISLVSQKKKKKKVYKLSFSFYV